MFKRNKQTHYPSIMDIACNNIPSLKNDVLICKWYVQTSRRSRIFLRRGPLSCEVPGRRDSVGGGEVVAEIFCDLRKPSRFSGGG